MHPIIKFVVVVVTFLLINMMGFPATTEGKVNWCTIHPQVVPLDLDWLDKRGNVGWVSTLGSQIDSALVMADVTQGGSPEAVVKKGRGWKCWQALVKTNMGAFSLPASCSYNARNRQNCCLKTKNTPVQSAIKYYGDMLITLTDNATFLVVYTCLLGRTDHWFALTRPRPEPEVDVAPETKAAILDHIEKLGFDPKNLKKDSDPFHISKYKVKKCQSQIFDLDPDSGIA